MNDLKLHATCQCRKCHGNGAFQGSGVEEVSLSIEDLAKLLGRQEEVAGDD